MGINRLLLFSKGSGFGLPSSKTANAEPTTNTLRCDCRALHMSRGCGQLPGKIPELRWEKGQTFKLSIRWAVDIDVAQRTL